MRRSHFPRKDCLLTKSVCDKRRTYMAFPLMLWSSCEQAYTHV